MKNLMLGTAMAVIFGSAASAQDLFRTEMDPISIPASDFIGMRVYAAEAAIDAEEYQGVQEGWEDIGEINDVILTRDGRVDAVLVDIGGFLGMGERQVALSMESVRFVSDSATADEVNDFFLVVNADRTILEGAPEYMRTGAMPVEGTEAADTATATETNVPAVDEATGAADTATATEVAPEGEAATTGTDMATTEAAPAADAAGTDMAATEGDAAATTDGTTMAVDGYVAVDAAGITADQLVGVRVYGPNEEDLGEISELVLDANGAPSQVIVDVGGFLGMGEKPVAIDMTALKLMQAEGDGAYRGYVTMTQEELEAMPSSSM